MNFKSEDAEKVHLTDGHKKLILNLWMEPLFTHTFALFYIIYKFVSGKLMILETN